MNGAVILIGCNMKCDTKVQRDSYKKWFLVYVLVFPTVYSNGEHFNR